MEGGFEQEKSVLRPLAASTNSILSHTTRVNNKSIELVKSKPYLEK